MSEGIYIGSERPKSKKAIKEAIAETPNKVRVEITSMVAPDAGRTLTLEELAPGRRYDFVGPDPFTSRKFYGSITKTQTGYKVT